MWKIFLMLSSSVCNRKVIKKSEYPDKVEVKVKLSLCFLTKHRAMKAYWGVEV
jgi:hypothetical protein